MKYASNKSGFVILLTTIVITLSMIGLALMLQQGSYRAQNQARSSSIASEVVAKDITLKRFAAENLMQQIVSSINNSSNTTASISTNLATNYASSTVTPVGESNATSLNVTDSGVTTAKLVAANSSSGAFTVAAWSPTSSLYSLISLPLGSYRVRGGTIFGREFRVDYNRSLSTTDNLKRSYASRTTSAAAYARIFEFPTQTAVFGRSVRLRPVATINGSVIAQDLTVDANTVIGGAVTVSGALTTGTSTRIGSSSPASINSDATANLAKQLEAAATPITPDDISVIRGNEFATIVDIGDNTPDAEGIPGLLLPGAAIPNYWEAYTKPFYQCGTRVAAQLNAGGTTVAVTIRKSTLTTLGTRVTTSIVSTFNLTVGATQSNGLRCLRRSPNNDIELSVDVTSLGAIVGNPACRSMYVDFKDSAGLRIAAASRLCVHIVNASNLSSYGGFSFVTPNRLVLTGSINTVSPVPSSIFAYATHYGFTAPPVSVTVSGQIGNLGTSLNGMNDIAGMRSLSNTSVPDEDKSIVLNNVTSANNLPPVTLKTWLIFSYEN